MIFYGWIKMENILFCKFTKPFTMFWVCYTNIVSTGLSYRIDQHLCVTLKRLFLRRSVEITTKFLILNSNTISFFRLLRVCSEGSGYLRWEKFLCATGFVAQGIRSRRVSRAERLAVMNGNTLYNIGHLLPRAAFVFRAKRSRNNRDRRRRADINFRENRSRPLDSAAKRRGRKDLLFLKGDFV